MEITEGINNHTDYFMWNYSLMLQIQWQLSLTGVEGRVWKSNYIPNFNVDIITFPCPDLIIGFTDVCG